MWVGRVVCCIQAKAIEHPLGEHIVGKRPTDRSSNGSKQRSTQQQDLDEIVEVARLEARVLPIVGECKQLLCARVEIRANEMLQ